MRLHRVVKNVSSYELDRVIEAAEVEGFELLTALQSHNRDFVLFFTRTERAEALAKILDGAKP